MDIVVRKIIIGMLKINNVNKIKTYLTANILVILNYFVISVNLDTL